MNWNTRARGRYYWRISATDTSGLVYPFDEGATVAAQCGLLPEDRRHGPGPLHRDCSCGIYMVDTPEHLMEFWALVSHTMPRNSRSNIGARKWGGIVACQVRPTGPTTVGAAMKPPLPTDPEGTYRSSEATLTHVYVPTGTKPGLALRIAERYPGIPVHRMKGPLHTFPHIIRAEIE